MFMTATSSLLKKSQASTRQGANAEKSAVYTQVHKYFFCIRNAVSYQLRLLQQAAGLFGFMATVIVATNANPASAQQAEERFSPITVASGSIDRSNRRFVNDIASVLRDNSTMRMAPVFGLGSAQNVLKLIYTRQADVGIIHRDVLDAAKREPAIYPEVMEKIRVISWVALDEVHIIADRSISHIQQLQDAVVNFGPGTENAVSTPSLLFEALNLRVRPVALSQPDAIKKIRSGEIAATVFAAAKPHPMVIGFSADDNLHLLPIKLTSQLLQNYVPAQVSHKDYPNLIEEGQTIESVATTSVMISRAWPQEHRRYRKIAKFVKTFFSNLDTLHGDRFHPKWRDVNLAAEVPGWDRFPAAEAWLLNCRANPEESDLKEWCL